MYTLNRFCCICFCFKNDLKSIPPQNNIYKVHFEKLLSDIPDSSALTQKLVCENCRNVIDEFCNFYTKCLTNHGIFIKNLTQLQFEGTGLANIVIKIEPVDIKVVRNCQTVNETFENTTDLKSNSDVSYSDENNFSGIFPEKPTEVFNPLTCNVIKEEPLDINDDCTDNIKLEIVDDIDIQLTDSVQSMKNELNEIHDEEIYTASDEIEIDIYNSQSNSDNIVDALDVVKNEFSLKYEDESETSYNSNQLIENIVTETRIKSEGCGENVVKLELTESVHTDDKIYINLTCDKKNKKVNAKRKCAKSTHTCKHCGKIFSNLKKLAVHNRLHTGEKPLVCEVCGQKFRHASNLRFHKRRHSEDKGYTCKICGVKRYLLSAFERHMRSHTGERPFPCDKCDKAFKSSRERTVHNIRIHTTDKPHACTECDYKTNDYTTLNIHKLRHTGTKPHACEYCDKKFYTSAEVKKHTRVHTGERPYACKVCGKTFKDSSDLYTHKLSKSHDLSERQKILKKKQKEHICEVCGKVFYKSSTLTIHIRSHTGEKPYPCKLCHMKFTNSSALRNHERTHSEERPYPCQVCGKTFRRPTDVIYHMRTHTGEKPYSCLECGKRFSTSSRRNIHMKTHKRDIIPADNEDNAP